MASKGKSKKPTNSLPATLEPEDLEDVDDLEADVDPSDSHVLAERHFAMLLIDAENKFILSNKDLGKLCKYNQATVSHIRNLPAYKREVERLQKSTIEIIESMQKDAAYAMKKLLRSRDDRVVYMAASTLLNPTLEAMKKAEMIREMQKLSAERNKNQPEHIVYETEWGSTEEPATPGMGADENSNEDA